MSDWNAEQYKKFEQQRTLPAADLANSIVCSNIKSAIDIGCGIGNSTAVLKKRFPNAEIIGVDSSDNMIVSARKNHPELKFINLDAGKELSNIDKKFDVVFSNACIQWIPNHKRLLQDMICLLNKNGILAVQIPQQAKHPMHKIIKDIADSEKWSQKIAISRIFNTLSEEEYFDILSEHSSDFRIWETVYFHAIPSHQSILEWYKGTGLRPYLAQLSDSDKLDFEADVFKETVKFYPIQKNGEIIFRFPRLFFTAKRD